MGLAAASLSAVAAFLLTTALTIFILFFAVAFTVGRSGWYQLGISAAVLDLVNLACLACSFLWATGKPQESKRENRLRIATIFAVPISFVASHALSLALLIFMQLRPSQTSATVFGQRIQIFLQTAWALWGASLFAQILLIGLWAMRRNRQPRTQSSVYNNVLAQISQSWVPPSTGSLHIFSPPYSSHSNESSTAASSLFTERKGLLRSPKATSRGPISSSTKLTLSPNVSERELALLPSIAKNSSETVSKSARSPKSFSETSQFPPRPSTPVRHRLEPIPGSQPNSPGKPLDGPFEEPRTTEAEPIASTAKISRSNSATTAEPERGRNMSRVPPRFRKDSGASQSQPTSPVVDESHIHPLFRTDSPLPPPTPTLGSTITASAFGGQYISAPSRSRASSRGGTGSTEALPLSGTRRRSGSLGASLNSAKSPLLIKRARSLNTVKPTELTGEDDKENNPHASDLSSEMNHESDSADTPVLHSGIAI